MMLEADNFSRLGIPSLCKFTGSSGCDKSNSIRTEIEKKRERERLTNRDKIYQIGRRIHTARIPNEALHGDQSP